VIPFAGGRLDPSGWKVVENLSCLRATDSSNDLARGVIELYFEEEQRLPASLFVAEEQPRARGRKGWWHAPRGRGIYLTLVKRVEESEPMSVIPIAVARWTRDALAEAAGVTAELKWPNDLYIRRRKVAGILPEARSQGKETYIAVGIGVNVRGDAASLQVPNATTLEEETGRPQALAPLLQALLDRFDRELAEPRWEEEVRRWERASLHRPGDKLTVRRDGEEVKGEYLGLDASGFLRLKTSAGETVLPAGELAAW
jgi:BirA family biotin operon repressor/biotin-[acetyl-CoA-carboxylase] ligase